MAWYTRIAKAFGFKPADPTTVTSAAPGVGYKPPKPSDVVGTSGTAIFGGFIHSPEKNPDLRGEQKYRTYSDLIVNHDTIGLGVEYFMTLLAGVGWRLQAPDGTGSKGDDVAEALGKCLFAPRAMPTSWNRIVARAGMYRFKGFSLAEWTAKLRDDGLIGFADIESRPQQTIWQWDADHTGTVIGFWQRSPWDYSRRYIPRAKCAYVVANNVSDTPDGIGLLRYVVETARQLGRLEQLEGYGFELDLSGVPVARVPMLEIIELVNEEKITPQQAQELIAGVKDFVTGNHVKNPRLGLMLDSAGYKDKDGTPNGQKKFELDLLHVQASGLEALDKAIKRKQMQIARVLGIEGLMLGGDGKGSLALSKDKTQNLAQLVTSTLSDIATAFDADLVVPLMMLNGYPAELTPNLVPDAVQLRDVEIIVDALAKLAQAALPPDDPVNNAVRDLLGVPHAATLAPELDAGIGGKKPGAKKPKVTDEMPNPDDEDTDTDDDGSVNIDMEGA